MTTTVRQLVFSQVEGVVEDVAVAVEILRILGDLDVGVWA
jgi:hypothetical protein